MVALLYELLASCSCPLIWQMFHLKTKTSQISHSSEFKLSAVTVCLLASPSQNLVTAVSPIKALYLNFFKPLDATCQFLGGYKYMYITGGFEIATHWWPMRPKLSTGD